MSCKLSSALDSKPRDRRGRGGAGLHVAKTGRGFTEGCPAREPGATETHIVTPSDSEIQRKAVGKLRKKPRGLGDLGWKQQGLPAWATLGPSLRWREERRGSSCFLSSVARSRPCVWTCVSISPVLGHSEGRGRGQN